MGDEGRGCGEGGGTVVRDVGAGVVHVLAGWDLEKETYKAQGNQGREREPGSPTSFSHTAPP